jgi:hypothetical protein
MPGDAGNPHTCAQAPGHEPQLQAWCTVGTYSLENEDGDAPNSLQAGERVRVLDDEPALADVQVSGFVLVFYNDGTEVGSIAAGPQNGTPDPTTDIDPVYLTYQQSNSWTLVAGWTGTANHCAVVGVTSSPQVPQD